MPHAALFLPHLDVSGGLGMHCRTLVAALNAVSTPLRFTVLTPANPARLFPMADLEPFDRTCVDAARFAFQAVEVPAGFNLANELDPILAEPLTALQPDVFYCSYYTGLRAPVCRQIVAFHDAGFLENPAGFGETAAIRKATLDAIRPAISLIQCISADARGRICNLLPWPKEKTAVVWHALPDTLEEIAAAMAASPGQFADWRPYFFLPVGAATGFNRVRKNVPTAVKAFRQLGLGRLIIGGTAPLTDKVLSELLPPSEAGRIEDGNWRSHDGAITILPSISRSDFLAAMRHAAAVVYPSRYEGFGLPTIEAMALGVPLIAANATSIPEIVADAGLLVDPDDVNGFTEAMRAALTDSARMNALRANGLQRVKLFSLERMGREMVELFRQPK